MIHLKPILANSNGSICLPLRPLQMKTKSLRKNKVNIITLGCSKNLVDSEVLSGQLTAEAYDVVHENVKQRLRPHNAQNLLSMEQEKT